MSFDYIKSRATATKLLTNFGQSVTRRTYTAGTYNPATGVTTPTTADTTRTGALFDFAKGQQYMRGTLIESGDKQLLLDASATVDMKDHFLISSTEYTIVSLGEINPAGTPVLYDLHLRR